MDDAKLKELQDLLLEMARHQSHIIARILVLETFVLMIAGDLRLFAGTENALLKFALLKADLNTGAMRKDLEACWKRWGAIIDKAAVNAAPMQTDAMQ